MDEWLRKSGADPYADEVSAGAVRGLLKAMAPGVANINAAAKVAFPGRDGAKDRENLVEALTEPTTSPEFGVWPAGEKAAR